MMDNSRRKFVFATAASAVSVLTPFPAWSIETAGALGVAIGGVTLKNGKHLLVSADLSRRKFQSCEIPFHCHSVISVPARPQIALGVERLGTGAVLMDVRSARSIQTIRAHENRYFYGHAAFNAEGSIAYLSSVEKTGKATQAFVSMIDLDKRQVIRESAALGRFPHDIQLHPDGKHVIMPIGLRADGKSALVLLDKTTLAETGTITTAASGILAHMALSSTGGIASTVNIANENGLISAGALQYAKSGETVLNQIPVPNDIQQLSDSHLLSICFSAEGKTLAATCPANDRVIFFNVEEKKAITSLRVKMPTGICLSKDRRYFVVAGLDGFQFIDIKNQKFQESLAWRIPLVDRSVEEFYRHLDCA